MKSFNIRKSLLTIALAGGTLMSGAQVIHPLSFQTGANAKTNWYANYVGVRLSVTSPSTVAGDKIYTTANDGSGGTGVWGTVVTSPLLNVPVVIPQAGDSLANITITTNMTGKIALIYRGVTNFSCKATAARNAGAIACIIVNNVGGGPIGMALGTCTSPLDLPVFMISKADGDALYSQINNNIPVTITITPWGQNYANDLGLIGNGGSMFHDFAIPYNQLGTGNHNPEAYKNVDGAFIANFGSTAANNVTLTSSLSWTPTGGSTTMLRSDSVSTPTFTVADSVLAMYEHNSYDVHASGTGRFDLSYNLHSSAADQYVNNDTATYSMYATDRIWSKGRYDFDIMQPINTIWYGIAANGSPETWGPSYYVAKGGYSLDSLQFSMAKAMAVGDPAQFGSNVGFNFLVFQWKDGSNSNPKDGVMQPAELTLAGNIAYSTNNVDSSDEVLAVNMTAPDGTSPCILSDSSWYWVPVIVNPGFYVGCDGILDYYPRTFTKWHNTITYGGNDSTNIENYAPSWGVDGGPDGSGILTSSTYYSVFPFDRYDVDSVTYSNQKGIVPNIAMKTSLFPTNVKNVNSAPAFKLDVYPNPATDKINVTVSLDKNAKEISYFVLDGIARVVTHQVHNDVKNDSFTMDTNNLAAGTYYVSVTVDGRMMTKKFVVIK